MHARKLVVAPNNWASGHAKLWPDDAYCSYLLKYTSWSSGIDALLCPTWHRFELEHVVALFWTCPIFYVTLKFHNLFFPLMLYTITMFAIVSMNA